MTYHCWHDLSVKFPPGPAHTLAAPTGRGRVCCYCGETRSEPLPPMPPMRHHGMYVDDTTDWFVLDDAECSSISGIDLNLDVAVVDIDDSGTGAAF